MEGGVRGRREGAWKGGGGADDRWVTGRLRGDVERMG